MFGAGTIQWSWGLDADHDRGARGPRTRACSRRRSTCFADMGVQPATLRAGLVPPPPRRPTRPRRPRRITAPPPAATLAPGIAGHGDRHRDGHRRRVVGGVEVSTDGGTTWHPRHGPRHLDLHVDAAGGPAASRSRAAAADDSGNLETPLGGRSPSRSARPSDAARARIWREQRHPGGARPRTTSSAVELGREVPLRRRRLRHRGSLLQGRGQHRHARRPPVDAARARCSPRPPSRGETASGWQQVSFSAPGLDRRQHDLRRLLPRAERALRRQRGLLRADRRRLAAAARPQGRRRRWQRRVRLRPERGLPDRRVPDRELLGRRRLRHGSGGGGGDATPPTVSSTSPHPARPASGINANVTATFNEAMDAATITTTTFQLRDRRRGRARDRQLRRDHHHRDPRSECRARDLDDLHRDRPRRCERGQGRAGNALAADQTWTFTTARAVELGLPVQDLGAVGDAREARRDLGQRRARSRRQVPRGDRRADRRGCASTRAPPTPARTSATSGAAPARCSPRRRSPTRPRPAGSR